MALPECRERQSGFKERCSEAAKIDRFYASAAEP